MNSLKYNNLNIKSSTMSLDKISNKNCYYPPSPPSKGWTQQSPLQQLLLASQSKHNTIPEEDQGQLFDFYITPYSDKQYRQTRKNNEQLNEDTTILRFSKKQEGLQQQPSAIQDEKDSKRLKKIIDKKNRVIGELTEQLSSLKKDISGMKSRRRSEHQGNSRKVNSSRCSECHCQKVGKQIEFFQKNNMELFEQLSKCRSEKQKWKLQLEAIKNSVLPQLQAKAKQLQISKKQLTRHNAYLMSEIRSYIDQGKQQMVFVSKMRDIISEKTGLKQLQCDMRSIISHQASNNKNKPINRSKKITPFTADTSDRFALSESKKHSNSSSRIQKCLSIQMLQSKYKL